MSLTRYRIGEEVGTPTATDDMMLLTALYGFVVGIPVSYTHLRAHET